MNWNERNAMKCIKNKILLALIYMQALVVVVTRKYFSKMLSRKVHAHAFYLLFIINLKKKLQKKDNK